MRITRLLGIISSVDRLNYRRAEMTFRSADQLNLPQRDYFSIYHWHLVNLIFNLHRSIGDIGEVNLLENFTGGMREALGIQRNIDYIASIHLIGFNVIRDLYCACSFFCRKEKTTHSTPLKNAGRQ